MTFSICETGITWRYHIREVGAEGLKPGGGHNLHALCGRLIAWDVAIRFQAWGTTTHLNEFWCKKCWTLYKKKRQEQK